MKHYHCSYNYFSFYFYACPHFRVVNVIVFLKFASVIIIIDVDIFPSCQKLAEIDKIDLSY